MSPQQYSVYTVYTYRSCVCVSEYTFQFMCFDALIKAAIFTVMMDNSVQSRARIKRDTPPNYILNVTLQGKPVTFKKRFLNLILGQSRQNFSAIFNIFSC